MDVTVAICTFNRAESLARTLRTLAAMAVPAALRWEVLVVDNASPDNTAQVAASFTDRLPLRVVREEQQGTAHARNRALAEAKGGLLLYTDDDVDVEPGWLAAYWAAAQRHPEASIFGGKVLTLFETEPPAWLRENADWLRSLPRVDHGDGERVLRRLEDGWLINANMGFRRDLFSDGKRYDVELGPQGDNRSVTSRIGAEELELQQRLYAQGVLGVYVPEAVVHHRDPPYRLTLAYTFRWYFGTGREQVRTGEFPDSPHRLFGAPRYLWRLWLQAFATFLRHRPRGWTRSALEARCTMAKVRGAIAQFRSHA